MREIDQVMFAARRADAPLVIDVREPEAVRGRACSRGPTGADGRDPRAAR